MHFHNEITDEVQDLLNRAETANAALMRGDVEQWQALLPRTRDFTLMSPFGGTPTHEPQLTQTVVQAMAQFFRNGTLAQEVVQTYASAEMVVLVVIERSHVEVGTLPAQDWALRVTLVYRRDGAQWRLAHRHADPLVTGISLEKAAALARGLAHAA
jgi:ketosteroid isomerase-like protein